MVEDDECGCSQVGAHLTAFAIGALVGAGLAVIYAPCSGKETREALARRTQELKEKAGGVVASARDLLRDNKAEVAAALEAGMEAMMEK